MDEFYFLFGTSVEHLDLMWHWKRRNCSLWYSVHLRPLWRGFPLLLTATQLYQPMPVGFRPCSLSSTWAHCVPLASSPFSSQPENWWLRQGCSYVGKVWHSQETKHWKQERSPYWVHPIQDPGSSIGSQQLQAPHSASQTWFTPMTSSTFVELHHPFSYYSPAISRNSHCEYPNQGSLHIPQNASQWSKWLKTTLKRQQLLQYLPLVCPGSQSAAAANIELQC